ncbi:MAG: ABC transporter permease, partial [Acidobacteria bacterium]|nr:ABC transporter permease [Acidobacteriota bacterium]
MRKAIRALAGPFTGLQQDVRYGLRALARSPGFTAVALISLSLGIGVATSAFSEMNGFVLRDVPAVANPQELVTLQAPASYPDYRRHRELETLFSSTLAYIAPVPFGVWLNGRTERVWGHIVTPSYFATLGVRPLLGRVFDPKQEQPGQAPTAVISYRFWQNDLGSDPGVIGKTLRVNGRPCTIIGVGPKEFLGASPMVYAADLYIPIWVDPRFAPELADNILERRDLAKFHVVGRLRPGTPQARAEAALDAVARQMEEEYGDPDRRRQGRRISLLAGGKLLPVRKQDLPFLTGFFVLLGGMILLIASSNVTNMTLARAAERRKEIAIRLALGAGRTRIIRQLLTECMLLAAGAGVFGFLMAVWLMRLASQIRMPYPMPITINLAPDARVLAFTFALTVFTALAFGLVPALQATRAELTPALKEGGNVRFHRYRHFSLRNGLVLAQVAGSLALLVITGFLVIGHRKMAEIEVGFDARNIYVISLDPIRDGYSGEKAARFFQTLLERVQGLPAAGAASVADASPMAMIGKPFVRFSASGPDTGDAKVIHNARKYLVAKDYFHTIGIPILLGRGFRKEDEANDAISVVVSERLAQDCWKGQDPLGRRIEIGSEDVPQFQTPSAVGGTLVLGKTKVYQVVGVARNVRDGLVMAAADVPPMIYLPLRPADYAKPSTQGMTLIVRAKPGADVTGAVLREISAMDTNLTPFNIRGMPEQIEQMMLPVRGALWTYGFIGVFGLIL